MNQQRKAGVLLHPTSLPNGVLDQHAYKFIDWLSESDLGIWQMLPLTPPVDGISPYHSDSAFALNTALLPDDWQVHFDHKKFQQYLQNPPEWLEDYVLFQILKNKYHTPWSKWPHEYCFRDSKALLSLNMTFAAEILQHKKQQFAIFDVWQKVKRYANQKGIQLFGDIPIFITYNSVDVWANLSQFKLDQNLQPLVVTGVPPDYFSEEGQLWGNPHYDWGRMEENGFRWWVSRIEEAFKYFDLLRIDHFRGLQAVWEIPADSHTARNGQWHKVPGSALLDKLQQKFPEMPFIAEDLGFITPEVVALKNKYDLLGMSVLQFGFNGHANNPHALYNQSANAVVYTGTHDNDTSLGWFNSLDEPTQKIVLDQLSAKETPMPWPLIDAALASPARLSIIPMQDWLGFGTSTRMNTPGTISNNWSWRFQWHDVPEQLSNKIKALVEKTQRSESVMANAGNEGFPHG